MSCRREGVAGLSEGGTESGGLGGGRADAGVQRGLGAAVVQQGPGLAERGGAPAAASYDGDGFRVQGRADREDGGGKVLKRLRERFLGGAVRELPMRRR